MGEFNSDDCPHHPRNDGECRHHWICDQLKQWEREGKPSEEDLKNQAKHSGRMTNDKQDAKFRAGRYGLISV